MKRDHTLFTITLILLFIAPKLSIAKFVSGLPELSSVSMGIVGLTFWTMLSPGLLLKGLRCIYKSWNMLLIVFALYSFVISLISIKIISIMYSIQYLYYCLFGTLMIQGYFIESRRKNQFELTKRIITIIAVIYSLGIMLSVFTGPIYPDQVLWSARIINGVRIQRGVGFSENVNMAAATMLFFLPYLIYMSPGTYGNTKQFLYSAVGFFALICTLSRSGILSFIIGLLILNVFILVRIIVSGKIKVRYVKTIFIVICIMGCLVLCITIVGKLLKIEKYLAILELVGIRRKSVVNSDISERLTLWLRGISQWLSKGLFHSVFGQGFRNSQMIGQYGAWSTTHNAYISFLGDFGIIGTSIYIFMLISSLLHSSTLLICSSSRLHKFTFLTVISLFLHNMTEAFFYSPAITIILVLTYIIYDAEMK